jgi:two-component system nitrate/nitrite sensor histidine kinase NarX
VDVKLKKENGQFQVTVKDDGRGFRISSVEQNEHFGLQIIRARAAHINGKILVESELGIGTQVTLIWPEAK